MKKIITMMLLMLIAMSAQAKDIHQDSFAPFGMSMNSNRLNEYCSDNSVCERNLMLFAFEVHMRNQTLREGDGFGKGCYYKTIGRERNHYLSRQKNIPLDRVDDWRKQQLEEQLKSPNSQWTLGQEMELEQKILADLESKVVDIAVGFIKNNNQMGRTLFPPCDK